MSTVLWLIAVALAVVGIVRLFQGDWLWGLALLVAALLIGPGGVSIFT